MEDDCKYKLHWNKQLVPRNTFWSTYNAWGGWAWIYSYAKFVMIFDYLRQFFCIKKVDRMHAPRLI